MKEAAAQFGKRRYTSRLRPARGFPAATAWVDLFFLLLLFIVMASSVVKISGINIELPEMPANYYSGMTQFIVTVTAPTSDIPARIFFQDREYTLEELRQSFYDISEPASKTIIIRADVKVPSGTLADIIAAAKDAGLKAMIAVKAPDHKPELRFE